MLLDPTLAPGKFRKATATVSVMSWAATTNSLPGASACTIEDAQATFDDEAGRVQLIIDAQVQADGANNITQFFGRLIEQLKINILYNVGSYMTI